MDIFKNVGNFFSGVFGGNKNKDDEERKRREREAAAAKAKADAAAKQQQKQQAQQQTKVQQKPAYKPQVDPKSMADLFKVPTAVPTPAVKQPVLSDELKAQKQQQFHQVELLGDKAKATDKLSPEEIKTALHNKKAKEDYLAREQNPALMIPSELLRQGLGMAKDVVQAVPRAAATITMSATGQKKMQPGKNSRALFGDEEITDLETSGRKGATTAGALLTNGESKDFGEHIPAIVATTLGVAGAALDLIPGKKAGSKEVEKVADMAAQKVIKDFEAKAARKATDEEKAAIAEKVKTDVAKKAEEQAAKQATDNETKRAGETKELTDLDNKSKTDVLNINEKDRRGQLQTKEEVATSYRDTFNRITADPNLTPQQKVEFAAEAKARHATLLKELDDSNSAQQAQATLQAAKAAEEQSRREAEVARLQAEQQSRQVPVEPDTTAADDIAANNLKSTEQYAQDQTAVQESLKENPVKALFDKVKQAVYDPRAVQQKYDNAELKRLKKEGLLKRGDRTLAPDEQISVLSGRIENPMEAADVRLGAKYKTATSQYSVKDIIKHYGKEASPEAQQFANYRLFKDELERQAKGGENTLGIDPREMAQYVVNYEKSNPSAVEHNAVLRQFALDNMKRRVDAGIDSQEMYDTASQLEFYTPRSTVSPDDAIKPTISGFISPTAKGTKTRAESAPTSHAPLANYLNDAVATERSVATAERGRIIKDRADVGTNGFNVVTDAEKAVQHRDSLRQMADLKQTLDAAKETRNAAKTGKRVAGAELKGAEVEAAEIMRAYFMSQAADDAAIAATKAMSRAELTDLFKIATEAGEINNKTLVKKLANREGIYAQLSDVVAKARDEVKATQQQRSTTWQEVLDTTQDMPRDTQRVKYYVDGVQGEIQIPVDLAKEFANSTKIIDRSGVEKAMGAVGNAMKITWTGALAPVFKAVQIARNIPLAYRNADGLSGVDFNALSGFTRQLFQTPAIRQFRKDMLERGATYENALQIRTLHKTTADEIAARANLITFFARNPVKTVGDVARGLNHALAYVDNAQRTAVAYGAYKRARALGRTEEEALQLASQAPAKVFGDFNRVSRLAQNLEVILPYSGAIQAGARAMVRANKEKPLETIFKDATILASIGGIAAYSLSNSGATETDNYYKDMIAANKEYELDNNLTLVLPGAHRNDKGEWEGVVKIPLTPDFRPFNRATWKSVMAATDNDGDTNIDPAMIAGELFNEFTGDMTNSIYDQTRVEDGNVPNGILAGSPVMTMGKIAAGIDPRTGKPLADEVTASKDRTMQSNDFTSDAAKTVSSLTGGIVTPLQTDKAFDQLGGFGDAMQNREDKEGGQDAISKLFDFSKPLTSAKGVSRDATGKDKSQFYKDMDVVKKHIAENMDAATFKAFEEIHSKKNEDAPENILTSAQKSFRYMANDGKGGFYTTGLFTADKMLDQMARDRGEPGNPIFDLAPQELQKVLTYRSMKIPNAAKQNYTKDGEAAFQSLGLDNKWYKDFQDAESAYYDAVIPADKQGEKKTFSGKSKPALSDEQKAIEDHYYSLPEKSAERRAFLSANSWLKDYWSVTNDFTDEERKALGFNALEDDSKKYGKGGSGGGSDYVDTHNALNGIVDAGTLERLDSLTPVQKKEVAMQLQALFAPRRGGRASVTIGARANGNPQA
jgi:hypothetical protein